MGYRLHMSGEIHDWLAELAAGEAAVAGRVGVALVALLNAGKAPGPPTVVSLADPPLPPHPPDALDEAYQRYLHRTTLVRRRVADVQTAIKRTELELTRLQSQQANLTEQRHRALAAADLERAGQVAEQIVAVQDELAGLRRKLPGLAETERDVLARVQRLQHWVEAFRVRKEVLKASYTAAQTLALAEQLTEEMPDSDTGHGEVAGGEEASGGLERTAARLAEVEDQIRDALRTTPPPGDRDDLWPVAEPGLAELRPAGGAVRILFAVEPPGTALLIAVLDGDDAMAHHYDEAVSLASEQLRLVWAGQAPDAAEYGYADAASLVGEFFPGATERVLGAADDLVSRNRRHTLAGERIRLGLSQAQVAARMGVRQERVSAIERAEPGAIEVRTLASYVEALGGQLEILANFGDHRATLR